MGGPSVVPRAGAVERQLAEVLEHLDSALAGPLAALRDAAEAVEPDEPAADRESLELIVREARELPGLARDFFDQVRSARGPTPDSDVP